MITLLIAVLLDTSGSPAMEVPRAGIRGPVVVPEGGSEELVACARAWSTALGYGGEIGFGRNPH